MARMKETYENVLPWYAAQARQGKRIALATLVAADGSSPRPVGSQIAVTEDGHYYGYITGGCAETAIHGEAVQVIRSSQAKLLRYGAGSSFMDIQLPCGAGIDVLVSMPSLSEIESTLSTLETRHPARLLLLPADQEAPIVSGFLSEPFVARDWTREYTPTPALQIIGRGPIVTSLAHLAITADFEVQVSSPDTDVVAMLAEGIATSHLTTPDRYAPSYSDVWSAGVLLFHDHEWEPPLLQKLLGTECFYLAALGSNKTHAQRCEHLTSLGMDRAQIDRISGPAGLDIGAQTPQEIAVSILAELVAAYRQHGLSR
ncbi:MAG: XdhC family protein [Aquisalinus sp.]|nr:XdhC family protein [Aquisalinus sp.]